MRFCVPFCIVLLIIQIIDKHVFFYIIYENNKLYKKHAVTEIYII